MSAKAVRGQTIYDICIQELGSLEHIGQLLADNDIPADHHTSSGEEFEITGESDQQVTAMFRQRGIRAVNGEQDATRYPGGDYSDDYGNDYS